MGYPDARMAYTLWDQRLVCENAIVMPEFVPLAMSVILTHYRATGEVWGLRRNVIERGGEEARHCFLLDTVLGTEQGTTH